MKTIDHLFYALKLAEKRRGFCAPNPAVGAILVKDNQIIGEGYHERAGEAHAEVVAIHAAKRLGNHTEGADLFVTLEPCCHYGKTPPCTDAIMAAGIKRVFFGFSDPNPMVSGKSEKILQEQGILVEYVPVSEIKQFYQSYAYWVQTRKPYVMAKLAISLDGKIAGKNGQPIKLTSPKLDWMTHQYRQYSDGILTTVKTILQDDPKLNVRLTTPPVAKPIYVIDRQLQLPLTAAIFSTAQSITVFYQKISGDSRQTQRQLDLEKKGVTCIPIEEKTKTSRLSLSAIMTEIGKKGCHDLWVEAGGTLFTSLAQEQLAQQLLIYVVPEILGEEAWPAFSLPFNLADSNIHWFGIDKEVIGEVLYSI